MPRTKSLRGGKTIEDLQQEVAALRQELQWRERVWPSNLDLADRVFRSLLPQPVRRSNIDVEARYVAKSALSNNYCQVLFPRDEECCITMCDVTGQGVGPALLATRISSEVRTLVHRNLRPAEIVQSLNEFVFRHFRETGLAVSFVANHIDLNRRILTYSGAGHPSPILIRQLAHRADALRSQNLILGVTEDCFGQEPEQAIALSRGDRLLLFNDSVIEIMGPDGKGLGVEGLARIAAITCAGDFSETMDCILNRLETIRVGPMQDDVLLILAEIK